MDYVLDGCKLPNAWGLHGGSAKLLNERHPKLLPQTQAYVLMENMYL